MQRLYLRENIRRSGLKVSEISRLTGIPYMTVHDWLSGKTAVERMRLDHAVTLAWFLGISLEEFVRGTIFMALDGRPSPCRATCIALDGETFPVYFERRK